MKKFLIINIIVFIFLFNLVGEFVEKQSTPIDHSYFVKTEDKDIYIAKNDNWEKINLTGVNVDNSKPGVYPSENEVSEDEFYDIIEKIYEMGANSIKVPNLMSPSFYSALNRFNENKENPIYVIQGIYFDEVNLRDGYDPQNHNLEQLFKTNIKYVVDSVHGKSNNTSNSGTINSYKSDASDYIIGYIVGIEFAKHDIIYTEIMNEKERYNGKYLYTDSDASSFESYMAKLGDYLADYEYDKYNNQKLIGFVGNIYNPEKELKVKDYLNVENIKFKDQLKTGVIASYNIYPSYTELNEDRGSVYEYMEKINKNQSIPVIVGELGIPSSKIAGDFNKDIEEKAYINEEEQGKALVEMLNIIKELQYAGSFIFNFQDTWHTSSWNTKDEKILDKSAYWSDAQTYSQQLGLMTYEPGEKEDIVYPDDTIEEWKEDDVISNNDKLSLSLKQDEKYLYLMAKSKEEINLVEEDIYIDLDITPKSGASISSEYNLKFEDPVDFLIKIRDMNNTSILVHEYYNKFKFNEDKLKNKARPDLIKHTKKMDEFSPIYMNIRPKMYVEKLDKVVPSLAEETGKMIHGIANPYKEGFNSASDFYIGSNYIEIRIPWLMLNFMDPSTKQIQDDFYENLDTDPLGIDYINVGITLKHKNQSDSRLKSTKYKLDGWMIPTYHERLKKSYYIIKDELSK